MPTISMFYGILVAMYVLDTDKHHHPHIHIRYNEFKAVLKIPDGEVLGLLVISCGTQHRQSPPLDSTP